MLGSAPWAHTLVHTAATGASTWHCWHGKVRNECKECPAKFTTRNQLFWHLRTAHLHPDTRRRKTRIHAATTSQVANNDKLICFEGRIDGTTTTTLIDSGADSAILNLDRFPDTYPIDRGHPVELRLSGAVSSASSTAWVLPPSLKGNLPPTPI